MDRPSAKLSIRTRVVGHEVRTESRGREFTLYQVEVKKGAAQEGYMIWRRYSEFFTLWTVLNTAFPNAQFVLPPKRVLSSLSSATFKEREIGLGKFLESVTGHREAVRHDSVRSFLDAEKNPDFATLAGAADKAGWLSRQGVRGWYAVRAGSLFEFENSNSAESVNIWELSAECSRVKGTLKISVPVSGSGESGSELKEQGEGSSSSSSIDEVLVLASEDEFDAEDWLTMLNHNVPSVPSSSSSSSASTGSSGLTEGTGAVDLSSEPALSSLVSGNAIPDFGAAHALFAAPSGGSSKNQGSSRGKGTSSDNGSSGKGEKDGSSGGSKRKKRSGSSRRSKKGSSRRKAPPAISDTPGVVDC